MLAATFLAAVTMKLLRGSPAWTTHYWIALEDAGMHGSCQATL